MSEALWPIPPDWKQEVHETLEWLTSVADSPIAVEQRMGLRRNPRRRVDYNALVTDTDRAFFDNLVSAAGSTVFRLPLWFDRFELSAQLDAGATEVLMATALHEYIAGGGAVAILGPGPRDNEVVEIDSVLSDRLVLANPTVANWPIGTTLHPLTAARLNEQPKAPRRSDRVWDATLSFNASRYNPWGASLWSPATYRSFPVLTTAPDDIVTRQTEFQRSMEIIDSGFAEIGYMDLGGAGLRRQAHAWLNYGAAENAEFRSFLYTLRGRHKALWLPTFTADFDMIEPGLSADTVLVVARCGYADIQGVVDNRRDIQIAKTDGTNLFRRIVSAAVVGDTEELTIDSALGQNLPLADILRISIMSMARLDGDAIEIVHQADNEGASTCSVVFKTFHDQRVADPWSPQVPETPDPPVDPTPVGSANVRARLFNSDQSDAQYSAIVYPVTVDGNLFTFSINGIYFATGGILEKSGSSDYGALLLELIATDDNFNPLPLEMQPEKWEVVSAPLATVKQSVDRNTYILYDSHQKPEYAGVQLTWLAADLVEPETVIVRGQRPDGVILTLVFQYGILTPTMGTFIAVGNNSIIAKCTDAGETWLDKTPGDSTGTGFNDVTHDGNGVWLIVGFDEIRRSIDDGETWQSITLPEASLNWRWVCSPGPGVFVVTVAGTPGRIFRSTDAGQSFSEVTHSFTDFFVGIASDGAGRVIIARQGSSTTCRMGYSTDSGQTFSVMDESNGYSSSNAISYCGGSFIVGMTAPGILFSPSGAPGDWSLQSHSGTYTGDTRKYTHDGSYFWGNAAGSYGQTRAPVLNGPVTVDPPNQRNFRGSASGNGVAVFVDYADSTDATFTGIYTTTGSTALTSRLPPSAHDFTQYQSLKFRA